MSVHAASFLLLNRFERERTGEMAAWQRRANSLKPTQPTSCFSKPACLLDLARCSSSSHSLTPPLLALPDGFNSLHLPFLLVPRMHLGRTGLHCLGPRRVTPNTNDPDQSTSDRRRCTAVESPRPVADKYTDTGGQAEEAPLFSYDFGHMMRAGTASTT